MSSPTVDQDTGETPASGGGLDADALLADLASIPPGRGGHACHTGYALAQLDESLRARVLAALDNPILSSSDLCRVLNKHGFDLRTSNVARHRRRGTPNGCKCPREPVA